MPITLQPFSRRRFLAGSLAAGLGAVAPRKLGAAGEKAINPHRLALLSDCHLHADRTFLQKNKACEVNMWQGFAQACGQILALPEAPLHAIVAGDLAHMKGLPEDYPTVMAAMEPLRKGGMPVHLLLGNHDNREAFFPAAFADSARIADAPVAQRQVCVVETPRANLFLLDTLDQTNKTPGVLGEQQLAWLAKALDARPNKPAIILGHHDPLKKSGLVDVAAMLELLAPRKQVKAYVFGHTHVWQHLEQDGLHLVNLPPTAWIFDPARPRGWVDLSLREDGATFELRSLDTAHAQHGEKFECKWR